MREQPSTIITDFTNYFIIPDKRFSNYAINREGMVIVLNAMPPRVKRGAMLPQFIIKATGKLNVALKKNDGQWYNDSVERLLKITFDGKIPLVPAPNYEQEEEERNDLVCANDVDFNMDINKLEIYLERIDNYPETGEMGVTLEYKKQLKREVTKHITRLRQVSK